MPAKHWKMFSKSSSGCQPNTRKSIIFRENQLKTFYVKKYFRLKQTKPKSHENSQSLVSINFDYDARVQTLPLFGKRKKFRDKIKYLMLKQKHLL